MSQFGPGVWAVGGVLRFLRLFTLYFNHFCSLLSLLLFLFLPSPPFSFFFSSFSILFFFSSSISFFPLPATPSLPPYLRVYVRQPEDVDFLRGAGERDELDLVFGRFSLELVRECRIRRPKQPNVRYLLKEGGG